MLPSIQMRMLHSLMLFMLIAIMLWVSIFKKILYIRSDYMSFEITGRVYDAIENRRWISFDNIRLDPTQKLVPIAEQVVKLVSTVFNADVTELLLSYLMLFDYASQDSITDMIDDIQDIGSMNDPSDIITSALKDVAELEVELI